MLAVPDLVRAALAESQTGETRADASYQGKSIPLTVAAGSLRWDGDGVVETSVSFTVVGTTDSLVPRTPTDWLAPNGQEVTFYRDLILRGDEVHTFPEGVFRITGNDGGTETWQNTIIRGNFGKPGVMFQDTDGLIVPDPDLIPELVDGYFSPENLTLDPVTGLYLVETERGDLVLQRRLISWQVKVSAAGRMRANQRGTRLDRLSPTPGASMWDEIKSLSLIPVTENTPDQVVPASLTYTDRMQALTELAKLAGCVPSVDRYGAMRLRQQDRWLTVDVEDAEFDIDGTISYGVPQSDDWYNEVVAKSPDGDIVAVARITDDTNPFSVTRAGPVTYTHSSPVYTTYDAAVAGAQTTLERLQVRYQTVSVECLPEVLLLDIGDVGWMRDPVQGRAAFGEIVAMDADVNATSTVTVTMRAGVVL